MRREQALRALPKSLCVKEKKMNDRAIILSLTALTVIVSGCIAPMDFKVPDALPANAQTKFTYDYQIPDTPKKVLWKRARDYFAGAYGDSRSVFRVMDEIDGTIIGKGSSSWLFGEATSPYSSTCYSDYHIRFAAKDNKARLQLEIINSAPAISPCKGWPLPSKQGYEVMKQSFNANSQALKNALEGKGASSDLKSF